MKHTQAPALHNTHCCSSAWQSQPRKRDRLSEAACCLNFWLQPSATSLVSFIFNDSVNLTRLSPCGVCECVKTQNWRQVWTHTVWPTVIWAPLASLCLPVCSWYIKSKVLRKIVSRFFICCTPLTSLNKNKCCTNDTRLTGQSRTCQTMLEYF